MFLKNKKIISLTFSIIFSLSYSLQASKKPILPTFYTDFITKDLRYVDNKNEFTYYQNNAGLYLSTLFKVHKLFPNDGNTHFLVAASHFKKNILVSIEKNKWNKTELIKNKEIWILPYGHHKNNVFIGKGVNGQLHLDDNWVSYYNIINHSIHVINSREASEKYSLKLKDVFNKYYIPHIVMPSEKTFLYTAFNTQGYMSLFKYDIKKADNQMLYQSQNQNIKIEICLNESTLYLGEFGINNFPFGSQIYSLNLNSSRDLKNLMLAYSSKENDLGKIICNLDINHLWFLKNFNEDKTNKFDLVKFNLKNKKIDRLSYFENVTQFIKLDERIIIPYEGKLYVAKGAPEIKNKKYFFNKKQWNKQFQKNTQENK